MERMILIDNVQDGEKPALPTFIQPREHKAKVCVWADLTVDDVDRLNESHQADNTKRILATIFGLDDYKDNVKHGITVDLYFYTWRFAKEMEFNKEQTSAFFSIIKKTHEVCIETPFGNLEQTFSYFKDLVLCHAVKRPPHSIDLFDADQVRKISEYTVNTYFRHFKMYKYAFTPLVKLDLAMNYVGMPETETPEEKDEDEDGNKEEDGEKEEVQETETEEKQADPVTVEKVEESSARKELRSMISSFLSAEIKKMKIEIDEQIKISEESLQNKIDSSDTGTKKSPRASAKGKKK